MEDGIRNDIADGKDGAPANADGDRRQFLSNLGRFAIVTPPTITMLLSTSLTSEAIAGSGGRGVPGRPPIVPPRPRR